MFGNMKKVLLGVALVGGAMSGISGAFASTCIGVSYHSALQEQQKHQGIAIAKCDPKTEQKLLEQFYTISDKLSLLQNSDFRDKLTVSPLMAEYKKIFYNISDDMISAYEEYEDDITNIDFIIEANDGLPSAAPILQSLYESIGDYRHSLFWALVSCHLGYKTAPEAVGKLLILMRQ